MEAIFYETQDSDNTLGKTLEKPVTLQIRLKDYFNVITPTIQVLDWGKEKNFLYIPALKRYYFIRSHTILTREVAELNLEVDVLESWKEDILKQVIRVRKMESNNLLGADIETLASYTAEKISLGNMFELQEGFIVLVSKGGLISQA